MTQNSNLWVCFDINRKNPSTPRQIDHVTDRASISIAVCFTSLIIWTVFLSPPMNPWPFDPLTYKSVTGKWGHFMKAKLLLSSAFTPCTLWSRHLGFHSAIHWPAPQFDYSGKSCDFNLTYNIINISRPLFTAESLSNINLCLFNNQ